MVRYLIGEPLWGTLLNTTECMKMGCSLIHMGTRQAYWITTGKRLLNGCFLVIVLCIRKRRAAAPTFGTGNVQPSIRHHYCSRKVQQRRWRMSANKLSIWLLIPSHKFSRRWAWLKWCSGPYVSATPHCRSA